MQSVSLAQVIAVLALVAVHGIGASAARAQGPGAGGSLGGYGGSISSFDSGMGMGGPVIPYAGSFAGFMPYRMGGSSSLSLPRRGAPVIGAPRTSFSLAPMSRGMSPMGSSLGTTGLGGGMRSMPSAGGMGVMPPSFSYPFRQPPSLFTPTSAGAGMSM